MYVWNVDVAYFNGSGKFYLKNYVGIGTASPNQKLHLHEDSSNACYMQFTNSTTGSGLTQGMLIGLAHDEVHRIHTYGTQPLDIYLNDQP